MSETLIPVLLAVIGAVFGSFSGAFVYRFRELHDDEGNKKKLSKKKSKQLSVVSGRSMCESCGHELGAIDLIPVLSWLSNGGRCRYCKEYIGWTPPLLELGMSAAFVGSYVYWPQELSSGSSYMLFLLWCIVLVFFAVLLVYDLRWFLLPDKIVFPLIAVSFIFFVVQSALGETTLPMTVAAIAVSSGLFWLFYRMSDGAWIGGGDVKLGIALGLLLGHPFSALAMLMLSSMMGIAFSAPKLLQGTAKMKTEVPYGPLLICATVIVFLFGGYMIDWYTTVFLV